MEFRRHLAPKRRVCEAKHTDSSLRSGCQNYSVGQEAGLEGKRDPAAY